MQKLIMSYCFGYALTKPIISDNILKLISPGFPLKNQRKL